MKSYLKQFSAALTKVRNSEDSLVLMFLVGGVDSNSDSRKWLTMKKPSTLKNKPIFAFGRGKNEEVVECR